MSHKILTAKEINELVKGLDQIAHNLWWTWNQEAQDVFAELSPRAWRNLYHNAVAILHEVSHYELRSRMQDPVFADRVRLAVRYFHEYMNEKDTWARANTPHLIEKPVAYFSAEFGFHETLPIAAGGLGVLAGDHTKSASDLGLGFVGISLFYREGYFMQAINHENWQTEYYSILHPARLPMLPVLDAEGNQVVCQLKLATSTVAFHAWQVPVGRATVYLLDTNRPENEQHYRDLTLRVYGGDSTTRIMQELLLGVGGVRLLRALAIQPSMYHMNGGHAAFLTLELTRERVKAGQPFDEAFAAIREKCIFTTHTPVEAGHDRFSSDLMDYSAHNFRSSLGISHDKLMQMGRVNPKDAKEPFCMTVLALRGSRAANGVSELHGRISREMWHCLYPDRSVDDVPIGHITNGVHLLGWMKGTMRHHWRSRLSHNRHEKVEVAGRFFKSSPVPWEAAINTPEFWVRMADPSFISDEELWASRYTLRRELIEFARRRLLIQGQRVTQRDYIEFDSLLNPDALTIGFARRFATYKRAPLVFREFENIVKLAHDKHRPLQFIYAGKAHPRDDEGKKFIQHIIHLSKYSELKGHLVFIENYDVHVARQMVSGCDVWLNNPRRPLEASGTSGQKTAVHGCLNLSILDGWWREGYDGTNGFAIGKDWHPGSIEEQDRLDSENLYRVLTDLVIPIFFERDEAGIPRRWIQMIRRAMVTLAPQFNTWRMVQEYAQRYYAPSGETSEQ